MKKKKKQEKLYKKYKKFVESFPEDQEIGPLHYYEIMDRASILLDSIDDAIYHHPAMDDKHRENLNEAMGQIYIVYNWAASVFNSIEECFDESEE